MEGDPEADTFKLKSPPVQMDPPIGLALITISGLTCTATVELKMSSQPLSLAARNTLYQVVTESTSVVKLEEVPPTSLTFCQVPPTILSCHW